MLLEEIVIIISFPFFAPVNFHLRIILKMLSRNSFVAEDTADFKNFFIAADKQTLQRKLQGNAQIKITSKRVMVRNEWLGFCAAWYCFEHWRFNLQKSALNQILSYCIPKHRFFSEHLSDLWVSKQIEAALAQSGFRVFQAVKLIRQRSQALG